MINRNVNKIRKKEDANEKIWVWLNEKFILSMKYIMELVITIEINIPMPNEKSTLTIVHKIDDMSTLLYSNKLNAIS